MVWTRVITLFEDLQQIKYKYPAVFSYFQYVQKMPVENQPIEMERLKAFIQKNPSISSREFTDSEYYGTKTNPKSIFFGNVLKFGTEETVDKMWKNLMELESALFPDGKPEIQVKKSCGSQKMCNVLEKNPLFKEIYQEIVDCPDLMENPGDLMSFCQTPTFAKLVNKFKSRKMNIDTLTETLFSVVSELKGDGDLESKDSATLDSVLSIVDAAKQGRGVDYSQISDIMQKLSLQ